MLLRKKSACMPPLVTLVVKEYRIRGHPRAIFGLNPYSVRCEHGYLPSIFLGLMVAYTPSLIFFAWILWRVSSVEKHARSAGLQSNQ
jgi:hypothetical protein